MSERSAVRIAVAFARHAATLPSARLCGVCVDVLEVAGAGVTLMSRINSGPVCSSNERTGLLENLQFSLGEGPCQDAHTSGQPVFEPDLQHMRANRWPNYTTPALAIGASGVFAFPLRSGNGRIGVLTLYQDRPGALSDEQTSDSLLMADILAETILTLQARNTSEVLSIDLIDDTAHRAEVHQATGIVAVQLGVDVAEALVRVRAYAYAHDRQVAAVAADIVARRLQLISDRPRQEPS